MNHIYIYPKMYFKPPQAAFFFQSDNFLFGKSTERANKRLAARQLLI